MLSNIIKAFSSTARTPTRAFSSSSRALDISKVILVGRLGADPVLRNTSSGKPYYTYTVATNVGAPVEGEGGKLHPPPTSWHTVFSFNEFQHPALQKLGKGSTVYVEAELEMRPHEPNSASTDKYRYDRAFLKHQKLSVINRVKPESEQDGSDE
ncbi:hypothetical protein L486_05542 [Kwoniella mangroviensis CBS 10435]|uniref:Nucleic acid-binding protein n=1 Tax=Kwoniella mangroviensis CBS 10435 TaxID=1331196 RepID=A0A1B9IM51_9TREE|nr:uncharacterized protein I203_05673 [Kwoniella mangroviensis CBS 8507]OCF56688.1 hypothetical protein L486_05542 [Kwoniella mangroviensis CBS 10435]OCF65423.1 hypothetical protein I203_05673 [Kwoniella mangroviensis CBS 8507]OCF75262.1 hypothetical protein I204_04115 [Kwoniella mangroviensis CBS 8886]